MTNEDKILEMLAQLQAGQNRMQGQINTLQDDMHRMKAYLELDVEKRFDAINEGIDTILERMVPEDRVEKLEDDVIVLKAAVRTLSRDVAELKKAQ